MHWVMYAGGWIRNSRWDTINCRLTKLIMNYMLIWGYCNALHCSLVQAQEHYDEKTHFWYIYQYYKVPILSLILFHGSRMRIYNCILLLQNTLECTRIMLRVNRWGEQESLALVVCSLVYWHSHKILDSSHWRRDNLFITNFIKQTT